MKWPSVLTIFREFVSNLWFALGAVPARSWANFTLTLFLPLSSCSPPRGQFLAITHVTVIDMTSAPPLPDQTVLMKEQRISAVGPSASVVIPRGTQVVDARGKFLIPGLADMHIHLTAAGGPDGAVSIRKRTLRGAAISNLSFHFAKKSKEGSASGRVSSLRDHISTVRRHLLNRLSSSAIA